MQYWITCKKPRVMKQPNPRFTQSHHKTHGSSVLSTPLPWSDKISSKNKQKIKQTVVGLLKPAFFAVSQPPITYPHHQSQTPAPRRPPSELLLRRLQKEQPMDDWTNGAGMFTYFYTTNIDIYTVCIYKYISYIYNINITYA